MKKLSHSILILILIVSAIQVYAQKWEPFNAGLDSIEINCMTSTNDEVFIGTLKNGVISSNIILDDWNEINNGIDIHFPGIHSIVALNNTIYAGVSSGLFVSHDKGNSWDIVNDGYLKHGYSSFSSIISIFDKMIYSDGGSIFLSENSGLNWSLIGSGGIFRYISSFASNGKDIFAGTINGILLLSSDGGKTWEQIHEFPNRINSLTTESNVLIVSTDNGVYLTNNLLNWTNENNGLSTLIVNSIVITTKHIFAATNDGIFKSEKSSVIEWKPFNDGLLDLGTGYLTQSGNMLFTGTYSGEVYKLDLNVLSVDDEQNDNFSIQPNPASDFIEININHLVSLTTTDKVQFFDVLGIEVCQSSLIEGNNRIDISYLPKGVYFIRIGNKIEKFLKM